MLRLGLGMRVPLVCCARDRQQTNILNGSAVTLPLGLVRGGRRVILLTSERAPLPRGALFTACGGGAFWEE